MCIVFSNILTLTCFILIFTFRPSKKANYKEKKYGFGGRKKRSKYNTAESYAEGYTKKSDKSKGKKNFGNNNKANNKRFTNKNKPKKR